jgi:hypothetical protein
MILQTSSDLTPSLQSLWKEGQLCDLKLISEDNQTFEAHKIILAAASGYFRALFVGAGRHLRESFDHDTAPEEQTIRLPAVSGESLRSVLEVIYEKRLNIHDGNVEDLLTASNYLDIPVIRNACCEVSWYLCYQLCSFLWHIWLDSPAASSACVLGTQLV